MPSGELTHPRSRGLVVSCKGPPNSSPSNESGIPGLWGLPASVGRNLVSLPIGISAPCRCGAVPPPLAKYSCAVLPLALASGRDLSHRGRMLEFGGRILGDWIEALAHGISDRLTSPHVRW
jgi:hypothetical protein